MTTAIFIFRRDFRLDDNTGLIAACQEHKNVIPIFIFDPAQVTTNQYKSPAAVNFMVESLLELDAELRQRGAKLSFHYGDPAKVVAGLVKKYSAEAVHANRDYTKFSDMRDAKIANSIPVEMVLHEDILVLGGIKCNKSGDFYKKFTPFWNAFRRNKIQQPVKFTAKASRSLAGKPSTVDPKRFLTRLKSTPQIPPGRKAALGVLRNISRWRQYESRRDYSSVDTTRLSPHNKFGTVSVREVHAAFKAASGELVKQLFWRDFYYTLAYHDEDFLRRSWDPHFDRIQWSRSNVRFERWVAGQTGYPIIDAGMRELAQTHYMHNRVRMLVASFLVKNLHIWWRRGEQYFAKQLIDYDPAQNYYNWCWVIGNASFSQPYFRVMNPTIQGKKYDSDAAYIKKWVPELRDVSPSDIHRWESAHVDYPGHKYPKPIVDYQSSKEEFLEKYRAAKN